MSTPQPPSAASLCESPVATAGPVHIIGSGLLGASIGMVLVRGGVSVTLEDSSPAAAALARDLGAGAVRSHAGDGLDPEPALVVVAVPPDVTAPIVTQALRRFPNAVVTDVASVKAGIARDLESAAERGDITAPDLVRYVGGHPMAGRERAGASSADPDLFAGRPWVVVPHATTAANAVLTLRTLAVDTGASPIQMSASEHDDAVAVISHTPQVVSSLVASHLVTAPETALSLSGQGLRDVTRIAASDPRLWAAILVGNAGPVARQLAAIRDDLSGLVLALEAAARQGPLAPGAMAAATEVIRAGNDGVARIPGKHGGARRDYAEVTVLVPDTAGELGRLFMDVGALGVNVEDFEMEHAPRQKVGLAMLSVLPEAEAQLEAGLTSRGWQVVAL